MPPQNLNAFLGAAIIGVISAAGMYIFQRIKQERSRHSMARDLARLDEEMAQIKRDMAEFLKKKERSSRSKKSKTTAKANSVRSASTADDYLSTSNLDSSDLEFYDISDEETDTLTDSTNIVNLENILKDIDMKLDTNSPRELNSLLENLKDLCIEYPDNPELLWRVGKAHQKLSEQTEDKEVLKEHISKGIEACTRSLQLNPNSSDGNKWYAILIGSRSELVSLQEKISDGHLFKKHVDAALALNPTDPSLHHMLGRFDYEVAELKWYERKVAAALFEEPPSATYAEALDHFMEAEKLAGFEWKENKLSIAKCKIAIGNYSDAVDWLVKADNCKQGDGLDDKVDLEVKALLDKYNSYR